MPGLERKEKYRTDPMICSNSLTSTTELSSYAKIEVQNELVVGVETCFEMSVLERPRTPSIHCRRPNKLIVNINK